MSTIFYRRKYLMAVSVGIGLIAWIGSVRGLMAQAGERPAVAGLQKGSEISERRRAEVERAVDEALKAGKPTLLGNVIRKAEEEERVAIFEGLARRVESDPDPSIRIRALSEMRSFGEAGAEVAAHALLSDPERWVRLMAARILASKGTEKQVDALVNAIRADKGVPGRGQEIAGVAISALGMIGGERVIEVLRELWNDQNLTGECRRGALMSLARAEDLGSLEIMRQALEADDAQLKETAISALTVLALRFSGDLELVASIRDLIWERLSSPNPSIRRAAARSVGNIGRREDIPLLERLLDDDYAREGQYRVDGEARTKTVYPVRETARDAIAKIEKRFPLGEGSMTPAGNRQEDTSQTVASGESDGQRSPVAIGGRVAGYVLAAIGVAAVLGGAAILVRKKHANPRK